MWPFLSFLVPNISLHWRSPHIIQSSAALIRMDLHISAQLRSRSPKAQPSVSPYTVTSAEQRQDAQSEGPTSGSMHHASTLHIQRDPEATARWRKLVTTESIRLHQLDIWSRHVTQEFQTIPFIVTSNCSSGPGCGAQLTSNIETHTAQKKSHAAMKRPNRRQQSDASEKIARWSKMASDSKYNIVCSKHHSESAYIPANFCFHSIYGYLGIKRSSSFHFPGLSVKIAHLDSAV